MNLPRARIGVALATLAGGALRLSHLGAKSFWLDEAFSVALARAPWASFVRELRTSEANMGLYYVILRPWLHFGTSESHVRLLSALVGTLTIPVVYALGANLFGRRAGIAAALALAVDPFHLGLSQDARSYPLVIFLVTCSTWAFVHVVGGRTATLAATRPASVSGGVMKERSGWNVGYVLASAAAMYAHFYAAFVLLAQYLSMLRPPELVIRWRRLVVCGIAIGVLILPLVVFVLQGQHGNINWIRGEVAFAFAHVLEVLATPIGVAGTVYAAIIVVLVWTAMRALRATPTVAARWPYVLTLLWLAAPIALPIAISAVAKPIFDPRYAAVAIPAIALLAGTFANRGGRRTMAAFAAMILLGLFGDWVYMTRIRKEDWREATQLVRADAAPGDVVAFYAPYLRRPYDYYATRTGPSTSPPLELYPPAAYSDFGPPRGPDLSLSAAIVRAMQTAPRTWLVLGHARSDSTCRHVLDSALRTTYGTVAEHELTGVGVWLYSNRLAATARTGDAGQSEAIAAEIRRECPQG